MIKAMRALTRYAAAGIDDTALGDSDFRVLEVLLHKGPLPVDTNGPIVSRPLTPNTTAKSTPFSPQNRRRRGSACRRTGRTTSSCRSPSSSLRPAVLRLGRSAFARVRRVWIFFSTPVQKTIFRPAWGGPRRFWPSPSQRPISSTGPASGRRRCALESDRARLRVC